MQRGLYSAKKWNVIGRCTREKWKSENGVRRRKYVDRLWSPVCLGFGAFCGFFCLLWICNVYLMFHLNNIDFQTNGIKKVEYKIFWKEEVLFLLSLINLDKIEILPWILFNFSGGGGVRQNLENLLQIFL